MRIAQTFEVGSVFTVHGRLLQYGCTALGACCAPCERVAPARMPPASSDALEVSALLQRGSEQLQPLIRIDRTTSLGCGSFGNVFPARWAQHPTSSKGRSEMPLAVKVIRVARLSEKAQAQIRREVFLHCKLSHPNIVPCFGAFESPQATLHLVLQRAAGDLGKALRNGAGAAVRRLTPRFIGHLLHALAHLHDVANVVHSDVKPSNLLVSLDGQTVLLGDLGAAARIDAGRSTLVGSPAYTAPEVLAISHLALDVVGGATYSFPADLWSVGVVLVELLTAGQTLPFAAEPRDPAAQPAAICFRPPTLEPAECFSAAARSLALRLMAKQSYLRPSAAEALEEFHSYFSPSAAAATSEAGRDPRADEARAIQQCLSCLAAGDADESGLEAPGESAAGGAAALRSPAPPPPPAGLAPSTDPEGDSGCSSSVESDASPMSLPSWASSLVDGGSPGSDTRLELLS